ncbi:MAG: metallophosphoesterase [Treponema sp.]|nr:metallophosphoesterase [Treponema sp.]
MKRFFVCAAIAAAALCLCACKAIEYGFYQLLDHGPAVDDRVGELIDLTGGDVPAVSGGSYAFLVISDVHFGKTDEERHDQEFLNTLQALKASLSPSPSFCICLGDIADHGKKSELEDYKRVLVEPIEQMLGGKVYSVVGNHDVYLYGWNDFKETIWPHTSFYRFRLGNFSYYFLDAGSASLGTVQFNRLKAAMEADGSPNKIVSLHSPVYGGSDMRGGYYALQEESESTQLFTLFKDNEVRLILAGHVHRPAGTQLTPTMQEYILPTFVGDRQFAIVTVDDTAGTTTPQLFDYP